MSLFVWIAAGILLLSALVMALAARRATPARLWRGGLLAALVALGLGFAAVPRGGEAQWQLAQESGAGLVWRLNAQTWPLAVTVLGLVVVALMLNVAYHQAVSKDRREVVWGWVLMLLAGAWAVPAVLAASPATFGAMWFVGDIAVLLADLGRLSRGQHRSAVVWAAFARSVTWLMAGGVAVTLAAHPDAVMVLWLAILEVRLLAMATQPTFILPADVYWRVPWLMVGLLSTLAGALWAAVQPFAVPQWFVVTLGLLAAWGAWRWNAGRSLFHQGAGSAVTFGSLALIAVTQGQPGGVLAWGALAVFPVTGVVLVPRSRRVLWPFFGLWVAALTLWPFAPTALAAALWKPPLAPWMVLPWLALWGGVLALGRRGSTLPVGDTPVPREMQALCLAGVGLWTALFWGLRLWKPYQPVGTEGLWAWLPGGVAVLVGVVMMVASLRHVRRLGYAEAVLTKWGNRLAEGTFWLLYRLIGRTLRFFSLLLEGEGGVLWAFVLLVMLAVLLQR